MKELGLSSCLVLVGRRRTENVYGYLVPAGGGCWLFVGQAVMYVGDSQKGQVGLMVGMRGGGELLRGSRQ